MSKLFKKKNGRRHIEFSQFCLVVILVCLLVILVHTSFVILVCLLVILVHKSSGIMPFMVARAACHLYLSRMLLKQFL